jgi:hypothetical protein
MICYDNIAVIPSKYGFANNSLPEAKAGTTGSLSIYKTSTEQYVLAHPNFSGHYYIFTDDSKFIISKENLLWVSQPPNLGLECKSLNAKSEKPST